MKLDDKKAFPILGIIFAIGIVISLFLVYQHFNKDASKLCTFGDFSCSIVNTSPYANVDGISYLLVVEYGLPFPYVNISNMNFVFDLLTSNAFLGLVMLLILFLMLVAWRRKQKFLFVPSEKVRKAMLGILISGAIYGLYLLWIEETVLKTYCLFCLLLDIAIISSLVITAFFIRD